MTTRPPSGPAGPRKRSLPTPRPSLPSTPSTSYPPSRRPSAGPLPQQHIYASLPYNQDDDTIEYIPILPARNGKTTPIMMESYPAALEYSPASPPRSGLYSGKRPYYLSLSEAVQDDSQPEFDAQKLYPGGGASWNDSSSDISNEYAAVKSPTLFPRGLPKPSKKHPFAQGFEPPNWRLVIIHIVICLIAYPIMQIFVVIAGGKSLFWSRLVIGAGCGVIGFILGLSLLRMGRSILEAATWATVIHQSRIPDGPGVRLKDLAVHTEDPTSSWSALRLLWDRHTYAGAARDYRRSYDRRPWSLYILFFLSLIASAALLPFILGRIVSITTSLRYQHETYQEIAIAAASSADDLKRANNLAPYFNDFRLTWTLAPFSAHGSIPPIVAFPWGAGNNETVYFSETALSQLVPNGSGFGTFLNNATAQSADKVDAPNVGKKTNPSAGVEPGSTIRYPRWGIRIKCAKLTDSTNIVARSQASYTYVFLPRDTLRSLFSSFNLSFPAILEAPLDPTTVIGGNDTVANALSNVNVNTSAKGALFYDNGVGHSLWSIPLDMGESGKGFTTIETILVRLNTTFAPNGKFLTLSDQPTPDVNGTETRIGYDAAVCLQLYEPWILETYNSTLGSPISMRIVDKSPVIQDTGGIIEKRAKTLSLDPNIQLSLNSTLLTGVYIAAHTNSVNQIIKDNGRDNFYVPSPTLISFTNGDGPFGYTELSPDAFAKARAMADAGNVLPYFAGSGLMLARQYSDKVISAAEIQPVLMVVVLLVVLFMGIGAALFVPKLPLAVPRRGFEIYSWLAAFNAEELVMDKPIAGSIGRNMELDQIAEQVGELKFRYVS